MMKVIRKIGTYDGSHHSSASYILPQAISYSASPDAPSMKFFKSRNQMLIAHNIANLANKC